MPKYDERIDPYASHTNSMDVTHMTEEAKHKLSNVFSSIFNDNINTNQSEQKTE